MCQTSDEIGQEEEEENITQKFLSQLVRCSIDTPIKDF